MFEKNKQAIYWITHAQLFIVQLSVWSGLPLDATASVIIMYLYINVPKIANTTSEYVGWQVMTIDFKLIHCTYVVVIMYIATINSLWAYEG